MTRLVDRGAIVAAYVGIGMALAIGVSFLLVIPIEPVYWLLAPLSGLLIGYYANARADRRSGPWARILVNGAFAGVVTGLALAVLLLAVKALFFAADNGYRDASSGASLSCRTSFYWSQQLSTAGILLAVTAGGGLGGAILFGLAGPRRNQTVRRDNSPESQPEIGGRPA